MQRKDILMENERTMNLVLPLIYFTLLNIHILTYTQTEINTTAMERKEKKKNELAKQWLRHTEVREE